VSLAKTLIVMRPQGLYCPSGDFYIDPMQAVPRALITHAHSDHARPGSQAYLGAASGSGLVRERLGQQARIETLRFGETRRIGEATVSFHPAGHVLGSAQIRIEHRGAVAVVSGDYKRQNDPAAEAFEPVRCNYFISECTFGLPVYRWPDPAEVMADLRAWWQQCRNDKRTAIVLAYALGKTQRILASLGEPLDAIGLHGAAERFTPHYAAAGVALPPTLKAGDAVEALRGRGLVIAPLSVQNTPWLKKFAPYSLAGASGWMQMRGQRRRQAMDRGFVLSDHVDWPGLLNTVEATGAEHIGLTHGQSEPLARYLREERGLDAFTLPGRFSRDAAEAE
jgi:putative mRNA 3-end processing factor